MSDLQDAMRSGDELRKTTIRMARSAIKNAEIARIGELDEQSVQEVLRKEIKQRRESAQDYQRGHRPELADKDWLKPPSLKLIYPHSYPKLRSRPKCVK